MKQKVMYSEPFEFMMPDEKTRESIDAFMVACGFIHLIQETLKEKKLLQKDLAKMIGVSESYLSQIFSSEKPLSLKYVAKIQEVLNITFQISIK